MASTSSTSNIPPPLPTSLVTTLLPHLLPPSPLPQELLAKSLLQRLLYLPPSPSDLDSYLSPFPSTEHQPISSRLTELTHGHTLGDILYTKEEEEIYAKLSILPENEIKDESIEIWFEFEHSSSDSRGWVYHSARIPSQLNQKFVSNPELSSTLVETESEEKMGYEEMNNLQGDQAPEGYWTGFDSSSNSNSPKSILNEFNENHEDAYWAQYSRPQTAPITPGIHTPGIHTPGIHTPGIHTPFQNQQKQNQNQNQNRNQPKINTQEEQAKKLMESLKQLGLDSLNKDITNGYSEMNGQDGKREFWVESEDQEKYNNTIDQSENDEIAITKDKVEVEESGKAIKDRLKCKISVSLNKLWKKHIQGSNELDLEIKAIEWLNFGKQVIENSSSPNTSSPGGYTSYNGESSLDIIDKLEILLDMYELLNETNEKDNFHKLMESVIRKSPDYRNHEDEDEVVRQNMYYE
ncbi:uncharacterized protein I206_103017 [Kwoniella pini CBS 10737]|uniref:Uncharacterized protein n=1 Tax=Kwoniella pini CBS 10737 TaxID=1296096 RepID=A0A1B9IB54_9TREE|nr:uncharacterized protein I206_01977 [Kwoniella pini CBS 10737]OCF52684.1 hypothetical protein I206_01977 [Kwoniella pini CBS 10737]